MKVYNDTAAVSVSRLTYIFMQCELAGAEQSNVQLNSARISHRLKPSIFRKFHCLSLISCPTRVVILWWTITMWCCTNMLLSHLHQTITHLHRFVHRRYITIQHTSHPAIQWGKIQCCIQCDRCSAAGGYWSLVTGNAANRGGGHSTTTRPEAEDY